MGNTHVKPHPRTRNKKQVHWKAAVRPSPPGKPHLVSDTDLAPDLVTVRWTKPLHDGGSPITGYLVEHRRTGSPHWVRATPLLVPFLELTLSGLEPGWRYQFRISAENAVGLSDPSEICEPITVTFQKFAITAPKFTDELQDATVLENEKVEFVVHFIGQPMSKICWFKDGFEIYSSRRTRILTESNRSVLTIHQSALSDEGEIKCTATNKAGHASTKAKLTLEAPPSIRLPRQYEDGLLFEIGEMLRLKVSVVGRPTPLIFWTHNGESIQNNDRYETEFVDKSSILKIGEAMRSDRGEYQIKAVNKVGEATASFLVTITDKPSPPGKARVVMTLGRSVTLSWSTPEDDGGCKIGNYIVEYYRLGWNVWLKAATSRQLTTILGDLIEGSEYKFRIKAESPYGVSEPSEESDTVFIPDPKRGITSPQVRSRSQPKDLIDAITAPVVSKRHPKPRSQSTTPSPELFSNHHDGEIPKRPERTKIKSPPKTPESHKKEFNSINKTILDRNSIAREMAYGSPEIQMRKTESDHITNHVNVSKPERSQSSSPVINVENKAPNTLPKSNEEKKTPSPEMKREISREISENLGGSSEFMLVLYPDANEKDQRRLLEIDFYDSVPPPISLSAPELGVEPPSFRNLKPSASSTELLHERTMIRLNEAAATEEAEKQKKIGLERQRSFDIPKIQINDQEIPGLERKHSRRRMSAGGVVQQQLLWAQRRFSLRGSNDLSELIENKLQKGIKLSNGKDSKNAVIIRQRSESEEREEEEFEKIRTKMRLEGQSSFEKREIHVVDEEKWLEDYEESLSEEETESSDDESRLDEEPPLPTYSEDEEPYHPRMISNMTKPVDEEPFEILTKRNKLPDPNFVPKPILKKTDEKPENVQRSVVRDEPRSGKIRSHSPMPQMSQPPNSLGRQRSKSLAQPAVLIPNPKSNTFPGRQRSLSLMPHQEVEMPGQNLSKFLSSSLSTSPSRNISAVAQISGITAASVAIPVSLINKEKSEEEAKVAADYYGNIVRNLGQRKYSIPQTNSGRENEFSLSMSEKSVYNEPTAILKQRRGSATSSIHSSQESWQNATKENASRRMSERNIQKENLNQARIKTESQVYSVPETSSPKSSEKNIYSKPESILDDNRNSTSSLSRSSHESWQDVPLKSTKDSIYNELSSDFSRRKGSITETGLNNFANPRQRRSPTPQRGRTINHGPRKTSKRSKTPSKSPSRLENWAGHTQRKSSPSPVPNKRSGSATKRKSPSPVPYSTPRPMLREIMTQTSIGLEMELPDRLRRSSISRQDQLITNAEMKVRSAIDYITDLAMFIVACWLYLFNNELLAIPVLIVMVYRQLWSEVQRRIPRWIVRRFKKTKTKKS